MSKRPASSFKEEDDTPDDLEDMLSPPSMSGKLTKALSGFVYTAGPSTRSRSRRVKVEDVKVEDSEPDSSKGTTTPRKKAKTAAATASPSPRKAKPIQMELSVPHSTPPRWRETYDLIKEMRKDISAPVDTMGCACAMADEKNPKSQRFGALVSLMLSSQTKDEVTADAVNKLRSSLGGELTIDGILSASDATIEAAICKVGFWRRKTGYIRQTAQRLKDDFDSDVPKTVDELCSLPGVGPKMAFLALQVAWNINLGIGVDVHVHRITNRLGWHKPPTSTPEQTRLNLQSWLPKDLHPEINPLLVGFGQVICLPVGPKCGSCTLSERGLCPSAVRNPKSKASTLKRSVTELIKQEELIKLEGDDIVEPSSTTPRTEVSVKTEPDLD